MGDLAFKDALQDLAEGNLPVLFPIGPGALHRSVYVPGPRDRQVLQDPDDVQRVGFLIELTTIARERQGV